MLVSPNHNDSSLATPMVVLTQSAMLLVVVLPWYALTLPHLSPHSELVLTQCLALGKREHETCDCQGLA